MTCVTTQKQKDNTGRRKEPGPLMTLLTLFSKLDAAAELFRKVRWANGLACPKCDEQNVVKYCKYGPFQRYTCKDCNITFNDKTGTILHYKQVNLGEWMLAVWMYISGPGNGTSINYIAQAMGRTYKTTYYMVRDMMKKFTELPEKKLSGVGETDEGYVRAGSKGVRLETNGEGRTVPSRRGLPRRPGRGTFEKDSPMITIYHQRATDDELDITIFDVPRDRSKTLVDGVSERFEHGSTLMTDEHPAYKNLEKAGYIHHTVNHSEGEYASGENNEIHTNNCECRIGLMKLWLRKHRGVSKWHLIFYIKTFQFAHNHRHYDISGKFVATMAVLLDQYQGRQA